MNAFISRLLLFSSLLSFLATPTTYANSNLVTIYIPAFNGPQEISLNVATVLNLQIWRTLRKAVNNKTFGRGLVVWDTTPLQSQSFESADEQARLGLLVSQGERVYPQFVFWGKAREFGSGIVVECFLSIPPSYAKKAHDGWDVTISHSGGDFRVHADLPQRRYEFSPIILRKEVVETTVSPRLCKSMPLAMKKKFPIGSVGGKFDARQQLEQWVLLESEGKVGWVPLPKLSERRSEVVDFVGGLIRIFRSDWDGANHLFERVVKNPKSPTTLKVDSLLYQALAKIKAGHDATENIVLARQLAPFYQITAVYSVMAKLEALKKGGHAAEIKTNIIHEIKEELARNEQLFLSDDPWLATVSKLLDAVQ